MRSVGPEAQRTRQGDDRSSERGGSAGLARWRSISALLAGVLTLALAFLLLASPGLPVASAQAQRLALAIDTQPDGNTASFAGPTEGCVEVSEGDTFEIDLVITDVENLRAWEALLVYDPDILELEDRDVSMFMGKSPGSSVLNGSDPLPDADGRYFLAAADRRNVSESGSGVLARISLRAKGVGRSLASLPTIDVDADGRGDMGPHLIDSSSQNLGDVSGDTFFDGPTSYAVIAVDTDCTNPPPPTLPPSPTPQPATDAPAGQSQESDSQASDGSATNPPGDDESALVSGGVDSQGGDGSAAPGGSEAAGEETPSADDDSNAESPVSEPTGISPEGKDSSSGLASWMIITIAASVIAAVAGGTLVGMSLLKRPPGTRW
jgi:hypothetical protein